MTHSSAVKQTFEHAGITLVMDPDVAAFLDRGREARAEAGTTIGRHCSYCGKWMTDPVSIARGHGPECAKRVEAEATAKAQFTRGARVIVDAPGWREVHGVVVGFHMIRKGRRTRKPVDVRVGASGTVVAFAIDQVRLLEGEVMA